jgi:hypothetical protein
MRDTENQMQQMQERLELLEKAFRRLEEEAANRTIRITTPLRVVDTEGNLLLEISGDVDGGYLAIYDREGRRTLTLGCVPSGGFLDIHHTATRTLVVSLEAKEQGGRIEVTDSKGANIFDTGKYG